MLYANMAENTKENFRDIAFPLNEIILELVYHSKNNSFLNEDGFKNSMTTFINLIEEQTIEEQLPVLKNQLKFLKTILEEDAGIKSLIVELETNKSDPVSYVNSKGSNVLVDCFNKILKSVNVVGDNLKSTSTMLSGLSSFSYGS